MDPHARCNLQYPADFLLKARTNICVGISRKLRRYLFILGIGCRCEKIHKKRPSCIPVRISHRCSSLRHRPLRQRFLRVIPFSSEPRKPRIPKSKPPSILLANLRSISNKIDEVTSRTLSLQPDVAVFTETWLDDDTPNSAIEIGRFSICRRDRNDRGGGILFYVSPSLNYNIISEKDVPSIGDCETEILSMFLPDTSTLLIGLYHPFWNEPSRDEAAFSTILDIIDFGNEHLSHGNFVRIILCGDFNDLRKVSDRLCSFASLKSYVDFPTRGSSFLDLILSNVETDRRPRLIPPFGRSDHAAVFWEPTLPRRVTFKKISVRKIKNSSLLGFFNTISTIDWIKLSSSGPTLHECASIFLTTVKHLVDIYFPFRSIRVRSSEPPWMRHSLKILLNDRDRAFSEGKREKYLRLREKVISHTRLLKSQFLLEHRSSAQSFWKAAKAVGNCTNGSAIDSSISASQLNDYFTSVFSSDPDYCPDSHLCDNLPSHPLVLTTYEVEKFLTAIKRKSSGPDGIPYWIFRRFAFVFSNPITAIFNRSLAEGIVPNCFKDAHITPIPKSSGAKAVSEYRPISLLPILSKVLEKLVAKHWIRPYMVKMNKSQFAYVPFPGRGTTTALTLLNHHILKFLDNGSGAVRVLSVDFSKAFDRLPHRTIIDSIINIRLPKQAVSWICSFLCDRRQRVRVELSLSEWSHCKSGVPQGSVVGPLLFCLATDSLSCVCNNSKILKYADDVTLLHFLRKQEDDQLQREVSNICSWSTASGLPLNPAKCHVMNIITKSSLHVNDVFDCDMVLIPPTTSLKILGVTFSNNLRWDVHFDIVTKKACKRLYIIRNLKRAGMDSLSLFRVYCALIRPVLIHGFQCFCNAPNFLLRSFSRVEKRVLRIINDESNNFIDLLAFANQLCDSLFMKIKETEQHPLREMFDARSLTPRNSCPLRKPRSKTQRFKNSFIKYCR